ncbi:MAG: sigma-54 dependent transcriptional regulator [candidate division Zixibacteria bacterium]
MPKILIVDDEAAQRDMLSGFLEKKGFQVSKASNGQEALDIYSNIFAPVAVIDMKMPEMGGLELLSKLRDINPFIQVIVLTAFGTVETAVEAMQSGAYGYLTKPVNLEELLINLKRAAEKNRLIVDIDLLKRTQMELADIPELIGESGALMQVRSLVSRVGPTDSTVMITGPSGSGKGLIAEILHRLSPRKENRFVPLNCASLPETLLESELFGHEKGAFTGADKKRPGRFELADGGTIFLDEIGDMTPAMQAKLLRVLEDGSFEPLGSDKSKKVDVRVISATNRDLKRLIEEGKFRQDLFFRINTVNIEMPPLRERGGDILTLAEYFIKKSAIKMNKKIEGISESAASLLVAYDWPGNVRELQNVIERAVVLSIENIIDIDVLPGLNVSETKKSPLRKISLSDLEREHIRALLISEKWNMQKTADILGIHRNTLRQKLKDYKINKE